MWCRLEYTGLQTLSLAAYYFGAAHRESWGAPRPRHSNLSPGPAHRITNALESPALSIPPVKPVPWKFKALQNCPSENQHIKKRKRHWLILVFSAGSNAIDKISLTKGVCSYPAFQLFCWPLLLPLGLTDCHVDNEPLMWPPSIFTPWWGGDRMDHNLSTIYSS